MDEAVFVACRLSKEGFGTVNELLEMAADLVIDMIHFTKYRSEFEETYAALNRKDSK